MGQVLARIAPGWLSAQRRDAAIGVDECGGKRSRAPRASVHRIAAPDNEEIVIRENVVVKAVNGAGPQPAAAVVPATKRPWYWDADRRVPAGQATPYQRTEEPAVKRRVAEEFETLIRSKDGYPFLDDNETVDYLTSSKTMFVLKGLPGSGKSHLAGRIRDRYPDAVICSADDFLVEDGSRQFSTGDLSAAHEACRRRVEAACQRHCRQLVVDNTHVRDREWQVYARLAAAHHYLLLLVEPDTPWRHDPARLAQLNRHRLSEAHIRRKLKSLKLSIPLYYGWILNPADCEQLTERVRASLAGLIRDNEKFAQDVREITGSENVSDVLAHYGRPASLLHCTARFCGGGRADGARQYAERSDVRRATGRRFVMRVTALLLTARTVGARVTLDDDQLPLWAQDDRRPTAVTAVTADQRGSRCRPAWAAGGAQPSLAVAGTKRRVRTSAGRRAHITLGCRPGQPAVVAGNDLLTALDLMEAQPDLLRRPASLCRLGHQLWYVDLQRDVVVDTVFAGQF